MGTQLVTSRAVARLGFAALPALITDAGERASERLVEFFAATIRNKNTRAAYARAVGRFCAWCAGWGLRLQQVTPVAVAAYIEQHGGAKPTHCWKKIVDMILSAEKSESAKRLLA